VAVKFKKMKKIVLGAALLLAMSTIQAAPRGGRGGERNILSSELPATLRSDIKTTYVGYWITDLKEEGTGKHTKYVLTIENPDQVLHLQADKGEDWEVVTTDVKAN
jgi:hypothetical protein